MTARRWGADDLGALAGRRFLVTGGNSGIGLEAVRALAARGAAVVLASRDRANGERAAEDVATTHPHADVHVLRLDLADLHVVRTAAREYLRRYDSLDVLVNNAGVMALPLRRTADGFEMQFGTNHLGHFALTGLLLPALLASDAPRVVTVSSGMHRFSNPGLRNVDASRGYRKWIAYGTSKLANLRFAFELQRRAGAAGASLLSVAAHPGYAHTNLQTRGPRMSGARLSELLQETFVRVVGQSAEMGALPIVYAAAADDVRGGDYIGPDGPGELRGRPTRVGASRAARDAAAAADLWDLSERLTGVRYDFA